jgi:transposase
LVNVRIYDSHSGLILLVNRMSKTLPNLADLPPDVQAYIAAQRMELAAKDADILGLNLTHAAAQKRLKSKVETTQAALVAERTAHSQAIQNRDTIIADLRMQLDGHKKHRFGSRSESLDQLALELVLEEHEIAQAAETDEEEGTTDVAMRHTAGVKICKREEPPHASYNNRSRPGQEHFSGSRDNRK